MDISAFKELLAHERMERPVREFLRKNQLSYEELLQALRAYVQDPADFVLCGDSAQGKVRNNVITLYQLLRDTIIPEPFDGLRVVFYSCGTVFAQSESIGHFDIEVDGSIYRVDPGVGACASTLQQLQQTGGEAAYDPLWLDGIILTHTHPDHAGDFHAMFERMRWCGQIDASSKLVVGNQTAMFGARDFDCGPVLDKYKKNCITPIAMTPGQSARLGAIEISAVAAHHVEAVDNERALNGTCLGYRIETKHGTIGVTGDTEWYPELAEAFAGVDILIAYITQEAERAGTGTQKDYGLSDPTQFHRQFLGERGVVELINRAKPSLMTVLTDFGDQLKSPNGSFDVIPNKIAERVREATQTKSAVLPAAKGLVLELRDGTLHHSYRMRES